VETCEERESGVRVEARDEGEDFFADEGEVGWVGGEVAEEVGGDDSCVGDSGEESGEGELVDRTIGRSVKAHTREEEMRGTPA
jgi:hypothetical protein